MKLLTWSLGIAASLLIYSGTAQGAAHTIQSGDSLWKLSVQYKTTVTDLMQRNQLSSSAIFPGQILNVPGPTEHTVNNESMWQISQKYSIPLDTLIRANPQISNPSNIWNGMIVYIPDGYTAAQPAVVLQKPAELADGIFPLAKGTYVTPIINNYNDGRSWTPDGHTHRKHEGVDIFAETGTPIYSIMDGQIINFGWNEYGGWRVTVRVNDSTVFYYAHLSKYAEGIGKGSWVKKGQLLGYVGSTGYGPEGTDDKFVPHLHFGIYKTGQSPWTTIDPTDYLKWWEQN